MLFQEGNLLNKTRITRTVHWNTFSFSWLSLKKLVNTKNESQFPENHKTVHLHVCRVCRMLSPQDEGNISAADIDLSYLGRSLNMKSSQPGPSDLQGFIRPAIRKHTLTLIQWERSGFGKASRRFLTHSNAVDI